MTNSKRNLPERNVKSKAKQKTVMVEINHFGDDTGKKQQ